MSLKYLRFLWCLFKLMMSQCNSLHFWFIPRSLHSFCFLQLRNTKPFFLWFFLRRKG